MQDKNETQRTHKNIFSGLLISVIKILVVLMITITFVFYITQPPETHSFFTQNTQSDTITRTVEPV